MAGHPGNGIIQDDHCRSPLIIDYVNQAGNSRMDKGRIPDYRYSLAGKIPPPGLLHTMGYADTGPHTDTDIHGTYRRKGPQCITTYIPHYIKLQFLEYMKGSPMGTTRAEHWRPAWYFLPVNSLSIFFLTQESFLDNSTIQFTGNRQELLAGHFNPQSLNLFLQEGLQLFHHIKDIHLCCKIPDQLFRQGINHTQFQIGNITTKGLPGILVSNPATDYPNLFISPENLVQGRFFSKPL